MNSQGGDQLIWEGNLLLFLFKEITEHCISLDNIYMRFILVIGFKSCSRGPSSLGIRNRSNLLFIYVSDKIILLFISNCEGVFD